MLKGLYVLVLGLMMCFPVSAASIMASVNDDVITSYDVDSRFNMMVALMGVPDTSDFKKQISNQILDTLINERAKAITAKQANLSLQPEELAEGIHYLERQNQMQEGSLMNTMNEKGIPTSTLTDQVTADLLWLKYIREVNGKPPVVTDAEVDAELAKIKKEITKTSYLLAEIFIPFGKDTKAAEVETQRLFDAVVAGSSFPQMAQSFSKGLTASAGGDLGWVPEGKLAKELDTVVAQMNPGQMSKPIKGKDGYYLILMREKQKALTATDVEAWSINQLVIAKNKQVSLDEMIRATKGNPAAFNAIGFKNGMKGSGPMPQMIVSRIPSNLYGVLKDANVGDVVGPLDGGNAFLYFMISGKEMTSVLPSRDTVKAGLEMKKMEIKADELLDQAKKKMAIEKRR